VASTVEQTSLSGGVLGLVQVFGEQVEPGAPAVPPLHAEARPKVHSPLLRQQATGWVQVLGEQVEPMVPATPEQSVLVASEQVPSGLQQATRQIEGEQVVPKPANWAPVGHSDWHITAHVSRKQHAPGVPAVQVAGEQGPMLQLPRHSA
jgi:hypothetical protein